MLRMAAVLVVLMGALSVLTTASAYKIALPTNPTSVSVVGSNSAQISVSPGSNNTYFSWVRNYTSGTLTLDLTRGPNSGSSVVYTFDPGATYTAYNVVRITNNSGTAKSVTVTPTSGSVYVLNGYVNGSTTATSPPFSLTTAGSYVELNLRIAASAGGSVTFIVTAN